MKTVIQFLLKVFVLRFYQLNAGFFLFLFFLFFGMVEPGQLISYHLSLMNGMIQSPIFLAVVCIGWLLYTYKCMRFCSDTIQAPESSYLLVIKTIARSKQIPIYLLISALHMAPVWLYGIIVSQLAIRTGHAPIGFSIAGYLAMLAGIGSLHLFNALNRNNVAGPWQKIMDRLAGIIRLPLHYTGYLVAYIFHSKKLAFAAIKTFSLLLLGGLMVRNQDAFDADLFGIFYQISLICHAGLMFQLASFAEERLHFLRNLPLPYGAIAGMYLVAAAVLLLPELVFMLGNHHGNMQASSIVLLYCTSVAVLFLYTAIAYACNLDNERHLLFSFLSFIGLLFLQKTGWHWLVFGGVAAIATMIFQAHQPPNPNQNPQTP